MPGEDWIRQLHELVEGHAEQPLSVVGIAKVIYVMHFLVTCDATFRGSLWKSLRRVLGDLFTPLLLPPSHSLQHIHPSTSSSSSITRAAVCEVAVTTCLDALHFAFRHTICPLLESHALCLAWRWRLERVSRLRASPLTRTERTACLFANTTQRTMSRHASKRPHTNAQREEEEKEEKEDDGVGVFTWNGLRSAREVDPFGNLIGVEPFVLIGLLKYYLTCVSAASLADLPFPPRAYSKDDGCVCTQCDNHSDRLHACVARERRAVSHWMTDSGVTHLIESQIPLEVQSLHQHNGRRCREVEGNGTFTSAARRVLAETHRRVALSGVWRPLHPHAAFLTSHAVRRKGAHGNPPAVRSDAKVESEDECGPISSLDWLWPQRTARHTAWLTQWAALVDVKSTNVADALFHITYDFIYTQRMEFALSSPPSCDNNETAVAVGAASVPHAFCAMENGKSLPIVSLCGFLRLLGVRQLLPEVHAGEVAQWATRAIDELFALTGNPLSSSQHNNYSFYGHHLQLARFSDVDFVSKALSCEGCASRHVLRHGLCDASSTGTHQLPLATETGLQLQLQEFLILCAAWAMLPATASRELQRAAACVALSSAHPAQEGWKPSLSLPHAETGDDDSDSKHDAPIHQKDGLGCASRFTLGSAMLSAGRHAVRLAIRTECAIARVTEKQKDAPHHISSPTLEERRRAFLATRAASTAQAAWRLSHWSEVSHRIAIVECTSAEAAKPEAHHYSEKRNMYNSKDSNQNQTDSRDVFCSASCEMPSAAQVSRWLTRSMRRRLLPACWESFKQLEASISQFLLTEVAALTSMRDVWDAAAQLKRAMADKLLHDVPVEETVRERLAKLTLLPNETNAPTPAAVTRATDLCDAIVSLRAKDNRRRAAQTALIKRPSLLREVRTAKRASRRRLAELHRELQAQITAHELALRRLLDTSRAADLEQTRAINEALRQVPTTAAIESAGAEREAQLQRDYAALQELATRLVAERRLDAHSPIGKWGAHANHEWETKRTRRFVPLAAVRLRRRFDPSYNQAKGSHTNETNKDDAKTIRHSEGDADAWEYAILPAVQLGVADGVTAAVTAALEKNPQDSTAAKLQAFFASHNVNEKETTTFYPIDSQEWRGRVVRMTDISLEAPLPSKSYLVQLRLAKVHPTLDKSTTS